MRQKLKGFSLVLILIVVLLLFLAFVNGKLISKMLTFISPLAKNFHLSSLFAKDADFYSFLKSGIVLTHFDYHSNKYLYYGVIVLALILIFVLDAYCWEDDEKGTGETLFVVTTIGATALFGVDFTLAVIIFLVLFGLRER